MVAVLVFLTATIGVLFGLKSCVSGSQRTIDAAGTQAAKVAQAVGEALDKFTQVNITQTFQESLPTLTREKGGRLELATLTATETFSRTDNLTTAWGWLDLGTTVSEIRVPATYRYYLRLQGDWRLDVHSNICIVYPPSIHPTLPPAFNTLRMEKRSDRGWARFNADEQMAQLEKDITATLATYAGDKRHLDMVREDCRKTVAEFVRDWLLREQQWRDDRFNSIKVIFPDEQKTLPAPKDTQPTIDLKLKGPP